jgi:hypothetical protein
MSEYDDLRAEVAALRTQVAALTAPRAVAEDGDDGTVSRRGLLGRLAGAAVAGAGLAVLRAEPAGATAGNPVVLGASSSTNDSGSVGTSLTSNATQRTLDITQSGTGDAFRADVLSTSSTANAVGAVTNGLGAALNAGILNSSSTAPAVYAYGRSEVAGVGVEAHGATGVAGFDDSGTGIGVKGVTSGGFAVYGEDDGNGRGVYGFSDAGIGVLGYGSGGYGGWFYGALAPLFLAPAAGAGHPASGSHAQGEVYVDGNGAHWLCIAGGTPGTWVKPGFNPVGPARLVSGAAAAGAFTAAQKKDFTVTGFAGIPSGVSAVAVNLSARSTAEGYVTLYPTGSSRPTASQLTFAPQYQWSGFAVVRIGTGGKITCYNSAGSTKLSLDVAGFFA